MTLRAVTMNADKLDRMVAREVTEPLCISNEM